MQRIIGEGKEKRNGEKSGRDKPSKTLNYGKETGLLAGVGWEDGITG